MANRKKNKRSRPVKARAKTSVETRPAEAITVAWTVSVTTVLLCNLTCVGVYFFVASNPEEKKMFLLQNLLLFAGAVVGILSLALLPVVFKVRKIPPPMGLVVFGVCVTAAPILAILAKLIQ